MSPASHAQGAGGSSGRPFGTAGEIPLRRVARSGEARRLDRHRAGRALSGQSTSAARSSGAPGHARQPALPAQRLCRGPRLVRSSASLGAQKDYTASTSPHGSFCIYRHTLLRGAVRRGSGGGEDLPFYELSTLGGFLQLSGYRAGEFIGTGVRFARVSTTTASPAPGFLEGVFAGFSAEVGRIGTTLRGADAPVLPRQRDLPSCRHPARPAVLRLRPREFGEPGLLSLPGFAVIGERRQARTSRNRSASVLLASSRRIRRASAASACDRPGSCESPASFRTSWPRSIPRPNRTHRAAARVAATGRLAGSRIRVARSAATRRPPATGAQALTCRVVADHRRRVDRQALGGRTRGRGQHGEDLRQGVVGVARPRRGCASRTQATNALA